MVGMSVGDIWEGRGAWERFPETLREGVSQACAEGRNASEVSPGSAWLSAELASACKELPAT